MTTVADLTARVDLLENRVQTLSRRLTQAIGESAENLNEEDAAIFGALKEWRSEKARELSVPQYVVFPDKALATIASTRPVDRYELANIKGVAEKRVELYGTAIINIVNGGTW